MFALGHGEILVIIYLQIYLHTLHAMYIINIMIMKIYYQCSNYEIIYLHIFAISDFSDIFCRKC